MHVPIRNRQSGFHPLLRTNLWLVPTVCVILAVAVFAVTQMLDRAHHAGRITIPLWIDQGDASDARDLLSASAGAIITTLGLVLSITVLTLSIAASQFGQRMLRRYMRDRGTQISIGVFAATFVFSLLTLLSVTSGAQRPEFVPWLSVWVSTALAVTCIGVLIYFVHHVAETIQVNRVVAEIAHDLRRVIVVDSPPPQSEAPPLRGPPDFHLHARCSGYLRFIDYERFAAAAAQESIVIQFLNRPGIFVLEGSQLAAVRRDRPIQALDGVADRLAALSVRSIVIGQMRAHRQDPGFALDQLVEVALRAMSPGSNDPHTMFACTDWLADALRTLALAPPAPSLYSAPDGRVRVLAVVQSFEDLARSALDQLREVIRDSPRASTHVLFNLEGLAPHLQPTQALELQRQAELINEGLLPEIGEADRANVQIAYQHAVRALAERVPAAAKPLNRLTG